MHSPQFFDSDNDGDPDLFVMTNFAAPGESVTRAWLLLNDGSGRFTDAGLSAMPPPIFGHQGEGAEPSVIDLNADGYDDLLMIQTPPGSGMQNPCPVTDLDNDGQADPPGRIYVAAALINNGNNTFRDETFIRLPQTTGCRMFTAHFLLADINGDGSDDVIFKSEPFVEVYLNNGHGFFELLPNQFVDIDPDLRWRIAAVDAENDGKTDFIEGNENEDEIYLIKAIDTGVTTSNLAPIAFDDSFELSAGRTLEVGKADGVLKNDIEPDRQNLTVELVGDPSNGTLTLNADGGFTYVPSRGFRRGTDSFTYELSDGSLTSNVATVTITVEPISLPGLFLLLDD